MWRTIVFCILMTGLAANKVSYENYKVFSVFPTTKRQLELFRALRKEFSYWKEPSLIDREVQIMIPPHKLQWFYEVIDIININYKLKINNVQKLIDNTIPQNQSQGFDFNSYHPLEKIYDNLEELAKKYPNKVEVVVGGRTYEGREIKGVKITNNKEKPGIFIEGGIHAREWISPATVMYILHQLLTSKDSNVRYVADNHNWFIFPIFNPDGYAFTFNKTHGDRLWKKSRKPFTPDCVGVDLNRNWDFQWNTSYVSSNNACNDIYPGKEAFSEIETKTMSQYMKSVCNHFYAYIAFHSYGQLLMFPYGHTKAHIFHYDDLYRVGSIAIDVLKQKYNTQYKTGCIGEIYTLLSGDSVDYVADVFRKSVIYAYQLRDKGEYGFLLPPEQIIPTGKETLDSLIAIFTETMKLTY